MSSPARFAAALLEVEESLDWIALGRAYCSEGGDDFFGEEDREAIRDTGLRLADDVATAIAALPPTGPGRSLYVGAALAEIAPMLCESLVLGRDVRAFSLDNDETRQINAALARASERVGFELPRIETVGIETIPLPAFDHLWIVSVLNDPEAFPALHDVLYARIGTELATGRGDLASDERRARELLDTAIASLSLPAVITTSDEELDLVKRACLERGLALSVVTLARLSAIVGDPVRVCTVTRRAIGAPTAPE
jgi:hypothetical protein